ncbi:hypothetical protein [Hymenobacter sp. B1770]|uniref:hypothetical protein n=1 Tax=Hymenobacter sp. B1770 TaxID=1718788 RepID=UPI003CF71B0F
MKHASQSYNPGTLAAYGRVLLPLFDNRISLYQFFTKNDIMHLKALQFLMLLATTAAGQNAAAPEHGANSAAIATRQLTPADTVRALHELFKSRRTRGALLLGGTGAVVLAGNIVLHNDPGFPSSDKTNDAVVASSIALLYAAPLWVVGTSQLMRFSKKKEAAIINGFTTKHTLPNKIQRRLKPSLFAAH